MLDGLSAAVVITGAGLFFALPEPAESSARTLVISYATDLGQSGNELPNARGHRIVDISLQSQPTNFWGLRYGVSAMINQQGTYMVGPGIGKTVDVGKFDVTLFIYPSYASIRRADREDISGKFNFRTAIDVSYRLTDGVKVGLGFIHISNGGYKAPNHGLEALRFTIGYDF